MRLFDLASPPPPLDASMPNDPLMIWTALSILLLNTNSAVAPSESGYAADIGALEIPLID